MAKIMIVDDSLTMREAIRQILLEAGHEVVAMMDNGNEAVPVYEQYKPDLVVLDIIMPGIDGMACMQQIFRIDNKAKVIVCSAVDQRDTVLQAITAGAKDFIIKPFFKDRFLSAVHHYLDS